MRNNVKISLLSCLAALILIIAGGCIKPTVTPTPDTTANNTGLANIVIHPEVGQYLYYESQLSAGMVLKSVTVNSDVCDRDYMDLPSHTKVRKGEPCLLVSGQVESQLDQDKYMTLVARGYDVTGKEVAYTLDHGPVWGVISLFVPARGVDDFVLHLKAAPDIVRIELLPSPQLYDQPPP